MDGYLDPDTTDAGSLTFIDELCHDLPKIELHRHLTGSLPCDSVRSVLEQISPDIADHAMLETPEVAGDTEEEQASAWALLTKQCHAVKVATTANDNLKMLFAKAIADLERDNVIYCEYRIGLKPQPTKEKHLACLNATVREQRAAHPGVKVKLLISASRHQGVEYAEGNINAAIADYTGNPATEVVGVELGGVTTVGSWETDFKPVFLRARDAGVPIVLHSGENKASQREWQQMMEFKPLRLGHCVYYDDANLDRLRESGIAVEACLTCHQRVFRVPYAENIVGTLPWSQVTLATDNPAFLGTTLSMEYAICCRHHSLTLTELFALARRSIAFTLVNTADKAALCADFDSRLATLKEKFKIR